MSDQEPAPRSGARHRDSSDMRFKWLVVASVFVIVLVLGTIQVIMK